MKFHVTFSIALILTLAACAGKPPAPPATRPAAPPPAKPATVSPPAEPLSGDAVWRLRVGLNVAALSCRGAGRASVAPAYRAVLARHASLLDQAYAAERRRLGPGSFDRQQTRLYNRFALQRSPEKFCSSAREIGTYASQLPSPKLAGEAPGLTARLESHLR